MAKVTVTFRRDEEKTPKSAEIKIGKKKLNVKWVYSPTKRVYSLELEGKRRVLPSLAEVLAIVDAMRASEMGIFKEKGEETRVYRRVGVIDGNTTEVLCDLPNKDVELQHLEYATNYKTNLLRVYPYKIDKKTDVPISVCIDDGGGTTSASPNAIHTLESIIWYELVYDETNNKFKFGLGYPLRFSNGLKIEVSNQSAVVQKLTCEAMVMIRG